MPDLPIRNTIRRRRRRENDDNDLNHLQERLKYNKYRVLCFSYKLEKFKIQENMDFMKEWTVFLENLIQNNDPIVTSSLENFQMITKTFRDLCKECDSDSDIKTIICENDILRLKKGLKLILIVKRSVFVFRYIKKLQKPQTCPEDCSICLDNIKTDNAIQLKCKHIYHRKCLFTWFGNSDTCPMCRDNIFKNV